MTGPYAYLSFPASTTIIFFLNWNFSCHLVTFYYSVKPIWVCLDGERIALFVLIVENSVRLVISQEI
jgi:hypothetical protein